MSDNQNNQKRSEKSDTPNSRNSGSLSFPSVPKLLCIVGSTGTGKTALALEFAKKQPSILISADSRQVYRGMDVVTGKDHPSDVQIYGIDIVNPDESCSVSVWYDAVMPHIEDAWVSGKLPIVVGGTGLYVKALTSGIATMQVPPDLPLRRALEPLGVPALQSRLHAADPKKLALMNESDRANPRRLIRAIEIASSSSPLSPMPYKLSPTMIGLRYGDDTNYRHAVESRVRARLAAGAVAETKNLVAKYGEHLESLSAIGYRSLLAYLHGALKEEEMVAKWVRDELSYAKRQIVWFKKQAVEWQQVDKPGSI